MLRPHWHLLPLLLIASSVQAAESCEVKSGAHIAPLVELYTAEGCSDCPPADAWMSRLAAEMDPAQVSLLALHVDYWDDIGWIDRFADPAYSQRQNFRVKLAKKKVIYTPHVMIGAETTVKWRDQAEVKRLFSRARSKQASVELAMEVGKADDGLQVAVRAWPQSGVDDETSPNLMWLALYQDDLVSSIQEGENKGKKLHHDRVTRVLKGPWAVSTQPVAGEVRIPLEPDADLTKYGLVLFAESSTTGAGLQSLSLPLKSCRLGGS